MFVKNNKYFIAFYILHKLTFVPIKRKILNIFSDGRFTDTIFLHLFCPISLTSKKYD